MADGRILSRRISRSHKLAALSSDTARMIYSWMIPYLDVEGRMEADPDLIKADIAPLLKHITPTVISNILNELQDVGLIALYSVSGRIYLQLQQFEKNQKNLRKDREAPSSIPAPNKEEQVRSNSGAGPEQVRSNSGIREVEVKLREEKLNARAGENVPVDNSKEASSKKEPKKEPDALLNNLREIVEDIGSRMPEPNKQRQMMLFVEANIKKKNHAAMMHCLKSLQKQLQNSQEIEAPKAYLEAALKIEDGKHNAREHEAAAKEFKKPGMMSIGDILHGARASP